MTVYFLRAIGTAGPIKIGTSQSRVKERLRAIQTWSPFPLEVIATTAGEYDTERQFHLLFKESRSHGEWFKATPDLLQTIELINSGKFNMQLLAPLPPEKMPRGYEGGDPKLIAVAVSHGGQAAFARKLGCTRQTLNKIMRGHRPIGPALAITIYLKTGQKVGPLAQEADA